MRWTKRDGYTMQSWPYRVCKTLTHGKPSYTLTSENATRLWCGVRIPEILGVFGSFDEAKAEAEKLQGERYDEADIQAGQQRR